MQDAVFADTFLSRRNTVAGRRHTIVEEGESQFVQDQNVDPGVLLIWEGRFDDSDAFYSQLGESDFNAGYRLALSGFARLWFIQRQEDVLPVCALFLKARKQMTRAATEISLRLGESVSKKKTVPSTFIEHFRLRRMSVAPFSPGKLIPALISKEEQTMLKEWKNIRGLMCMCLFFEWACHQMKRGSIQMVQTMQMANSLSIIAEILDDSSGDILENGYLLLARAVLRLLVSLTSDQNAQLLGLRSTVLEARSELEQLAKEVGADLQECSRIARFALCWHAISLSSESFRPNSMAYLRDAHASASFVIGIHPENVMFTWLLSQILRHMGRLDDASAALKISADHINLGVSGYMFRTKLDLACMNFVQSDFVSCLHHAEALIEESKDSCVREAVLARGLQIACLWQAGSKLDTKESTPRRSSISGRRRSSASSSMLDTSSPPSCPLEKHAHYYKVCYLFGFMDWFDCRISDNIHSVKGGLQAKEWRDAAQTRLDRLMLYSGDNLVHTLEGMNMIEAKALRASCLLLRGKLYALSEHIAKAEVLYREVLLSEKKTNWPYGFALYELAALLLKQDRILDARDKLRECIACAAYIPHTHRNTLLLRAESAGLYVKDCLFGLKTPVACDELGHVLFTEHVSKPDRMISVAVQCENSFFVDKKMKVNDSMNFKWELSNHAIIFALCFKSDKDFEYVQDPSVYECSKMHCGHFTALQPGTFRLLWDNQDSKYVEKNIRYFVSDST